jgi:hypothetical protein
LSRKGANLSEPASGVFCYPVVIQPDNETGDLQVPKVLTQRVVDAAKAKPKRGLTPCGIFRNLAVRRRGRLG